SAANDGGRELAMLAAWPGRLQYILRDEGSDNQSPNTAKACWGVIAPADSPWSGEFSLKDLENLELRDAPRALDAHGLADARFQKCFSHRAVGGGLKVIRGNGGAGGLSDEADEFVFVRTDLPNLHGGAEENHAAVFVGAL